MPPLWLMRKYMPPAWWCSVSAWILFASVAPNLADLMVSFMKAACLPEHVVGLGTFADQGKGPHGNLSVLSY